MKYTIDALVRAFCHWEDPETALVIGVTKEGEITVQSYEGDQVEVGATMQEALQNYLDSKPEYSKKFYIEKLERSP